jgi:transposase
VPGWNVHKETVAACVRTSGQDGQRQQQTRTFTTTTKGLLALRDWLGSFGVTRVGMESTGCYWKPVVRHEVPRVRAEVKGLRLRPVAAGR